MTGNLGDERRADDGEAIAGGLDALNAMDETDFVDALGDIYEHAPWAAARAWAARPFASVTALHHALHNAVRGQTPAERLAFFNRHAEPDQPGLRDQLAAYRARFGFPFILCTTGLTALAIRHALEQRLKRDLASERDATMREISLIARHRLASRLHGPVTPDH
jgi:2-oxo-4-hydroxy-4-carboxy-5-ureidoimidazoline decarboxylase